MPRRSFTTVDAFAPEAQALRAHFEQRFAEPRRATADRFVWDLWNVPGQYTALRTPAWEYFPKRTYDAVHQRLVWWGRRVLGCHDVSPPWLSCYVNGCEQRLHGDLPHGPHAFVFSLTRWNRRTFRGGETMLLNEGVLDFWSDFASTRAVEEPEVVTNIEPRFNRLTVFDPRIPHGVRRIDGSMDPREGRLVIHGWFVQPRPFIEGPLREKELSAQIETLTERIATSLSSGVPLAGMLSLHFAVNAAGRVRDVRVLCDTTRVPSADERTSCGVAPVDSPRRRGVSVLETTRRFTSHVAAGLRTLRRMSAPPKPSRALRVFLLTIDVGFIAYWLITLSGVLPAQWLYAHHDDPVMVAWNWSFLPLDLFVSASGLSAVWLARRGDARWPMLAIVSLAFTAASGANAIAFWALRSDFELSWWLPNLVLLVGPWPFIAALFRAAKPN